MWYLIRSEFMYLNQIEGFLLVYICIIFKMQGKQTMPINLLLNFTTIYKNPYYTYTIVTWVMQVSCFCVIYSYNHNDSNVNITLYFLHFNLNNGKFQFNRYNYFVNYSNFNIEYGNYGNHLKHYQHENNNTNKNGLVVLITD